MPRPSAHSETPSATERMIEAFWTSLAGRPFEQIAVKNVISEAQVTRGTFYYHFDNMLDLARHALASSVQSGISIFGPVLRGDGGLPSTEEPRRGIGDRWTSAYFEKVGLFAGPHGSHELTEMAKELVFDAILEVYDIPADELTPEVRTSVRFIVAGIVDLWGSPDWHGSGKSPTVEELFSFPIVRSNVQLLHAMLDSDEEP